TKEQYSHQISRYRDADISTYTELIIGLPGETLDSFNHGLCETLELGQHSSVSAYYCELLPNSRLSQKEYIDKYKIKTVSTSLNQYHCEAMDDVLSGFSNIIVSTDTMSVEDWIKANEFSTCVQCFHHFGLLQCFAMYARREFNIKYYDFYTQLHGFIFNESTFLKSVFSQVSFILHRFVEGKGGLTYQNDIFGKITYPIEEAVFLLCLYNREAFFEEIKIFLKRFFKDESFLEELLKYQKQLVLYPGDISHTGTYSYDFRNYFGAILRNSYVPLEKRTVNYEFRSAFSVTDWEEYAREIIWYGRRNCRMLFLSKPNTITEI
ncbi:MAG: hypothetical protein ACI4RU_03640, partial [Acutalibacteraceae bacterium]